MPQVKSVADRATLYHKPAYKLKFTGSCSRHEFKARCAEHDFWYHSFYFDNGFAQRGDYDVGYDIDSYGFPEDMRGMSVLDVGIKRLVRHLFRTAWG